MSDQTERQAAMKTSSVISVGHSCTESGSTAITIYLETERVGLSPRGARTVARQLLEWADHAETWQRSEQDKRAQQWMHLVGDAVEGRWVEVKPKSEDDESSSTPP